MAAATQRIPVLVTTTEKDQIARMAKSAGLSMGEYLRRAATAFGAADDERLLGAMVEQLAKAADQSSAAIDRALAKVDASNRRIAAMEKRRKAAPARRAA